MRLGIIGGSGLYDIPEMEGVETVTVETPFGAPSDRFIRGRLGEVELVFLPRHGRGHAILPSEINHRANLLGFKQLGVGQIIAFTAVGSLREEVAPRDLLLPDQYFDRTKQNHTFFGAGIAAHAPFGEPLCPRLREHLKGVLSTLSTGAHPIRFHPEGTYVNIEGPVFSTRSESRFYRQAGFDVIGMTSLPEARLAREASMCYAAIALVTDYDAWHEGEDAVTVEMVVANVEANISVARSVVTGLAAVLEASATCRCNEAMRGAVMTDPGAIPPEVRERLGPVLGPAI